MPPPPGLSEWLELQAQSDKQRRHPLLLTAAFLGGFFALEYAWQQCQGGWIERLVIDQATVIPAAWILHGLWPAQGVVASGHSLVSAAGRLNVQNGCEGLETMFLLAAAFMAYPMDRTRRLLGLALGAILVYSVNQVRLVILWQAWLSDRGMFGLLHGTVLPLVIIALCLLYFLWFINRYVVRR